MKVLSIDPAIKNLAIVKIEFDNAMNIIDIEPELIDITKKKTTITYEQMMKNLIKELDLIDVEDVDEIIIENQPSMKNPKVKSIAVAIFTYYLVKKNDGVHFVSPSKKLSKEENSMTYCKRKKLGVEKALDLLNDELKDKLNGYKKKDDVCDSILNAKSFFK